MLKTKIIILACLIISYCLPSLDDAELVLFVDAKFEGGYQDGSFMFPYSSINSAIREVKKLKKRKLVIFAAEGVYQESLIIHKYKYGFVLEGLQEAPFTIQSENNVFDIRQSQDIEIRNGIINADGALGFDLADIKNVKLQNLEVNCMERCITANYARNFRIINSEFISNNISENNIEIKSSYKPNLENVIINGGYKGLYLFESPYPSLKGLNLLNFENYGIHVFGEKGLELSSTEITWNTSSENGGGLFLESNSSARIYDIQIHGPGAEIVKNEARGIYVFGSDDAFIIDTQITGFNESGLYISQSDAFEFSTGDVNTNGTGIIIADESRALILEARINNNLIQGVYGENSYIDLNFIEAIDSGGPGVNINDSGNYIDSQYKIRGASLIKNNNGDGIRFTGEGFTVKISFVTFEDNSGYAIMAPIQSDPSKFQCSHLTFVSGMGIHSNLLDAALTECTEE